MFLQSSKAFVLRLSTSKSSWVLLYTADTLYGCQVMRPEAGFVLAVQ